MRVKKVWQILFFLILFGSVSCGGTETPTPTKPTLISEVSDSVTIIVGETQPDVRLIREIIEQPNCGGNEPVENEIERTRTIAHTIEVGIDVAVSPEGSIGISGTNIQLGVEIAGHLGYSYGTEESIARAVKVRAASRTHMQHVIVQEETWDFGEATVIIEGEVVSIPFWFRKDFSVRLVSSEEISCSDLLTATPLSIPSATPSSILPPTPISMPLPTSSSISVKQDGVIYTFVESNHEGNGAVFWFLATNESADEDNICLHKDTSLVDQNGTEMIVTERLVSGQDTVYSCRSVDLPRGVSVRIGLRFEDLTQAADMVQLITFELRSQDNVLFRDVPIPFMIEN